MTYEHYQLTDFQHASIMAAANTANPLVMAIQSKPTDDAETVTRLDKQVREIEDMVQLGFLKDTTGKILEAVTGMELQTGRKITAYLITDTGFDMFHEGTKRLPA
jgi:hypothetical protein